MKVLKIILIIFAVITLLFAGLIYIFRDKPFTANIDVAKSTNVIQNETYQPYIDTILVAGLDELNIKNTKVYVKNLTPSETQIMAGYELKGLIINVDNSNEYVIFIKYTSRDETIQILSHELIHFKQYYDKTISITDKSIIWKGKAFSPYTPYEERPWEIEAFNKDSEFKSILMKKLYK